MTRASLKSRITNVLEEMDTEQLQATYLFLQELATQQKLGDVTFDKNLADKKMAVGIRQLDNQQGTDFRLLLNELKASHGKAH